MCCESFARFKFDLGPLLQGVYWPISPLVLVAEVLDVKTTYRKSCAPNPLLGSDLIHIPPSKPNVVLDTSDGIYIPYYWS